MQPSGFNDGQEFISFGAPSPPPSPPPNEQHGGGDPGPSTRMARGMDVNVPRAAPVRRQNLDNNKSQKESGAGAGKANGKKRKAEKDGPGSGQGQGQGHRQTQIQGQGQGHGQHQHQHRGPREPGPRNLKDERMAADRTSPWAEDVDWDACSNPAQMFNAEIDAYYRYVFPTRAEFEVRLLMIELITRAVQGKWPKAVVRPFGSWQTQLYLPQGDIDLVVSLDLPTGNQSMRNFLQQLAQLMRYSNLTDTVAIIPSAKVPIIKFVTLEGKLNVDISVNQTNGLSAGDIINTYLDSMPGARQLITVVKAFLSQRSLNEVFTGGIGSYSVICLVLSFLQIHPKAQRDQIDVERNLGTLLMEFFELYGRNFNYDHDGISILRGGSYFDKRRKGFFQGGRPFLLSIEDPQQPDNDISQGSYGIRQVRQAFTGAHDMLQMRLFQRVDDITARLTGRYTGPWVPDEMSILSAIMGASKEMKRHREIIAAVHASGRLRNLLDIPDGADVKDHVVNYRLPHLLADTSASHPIQAGGSGAGSRGGEREVSRATPASGSGGGSQNIRHGASAHGGTRDFPVELDDWSDSENGASARKRRKALNGQRGAPRAGLGAVMMDDDEGLYEAEQEYTLDLDEDEDDDGDVIEITRESFSPNIGRARGYATGRVDQVDGVAPFVPAPVGASDGVKTEAPQARTGVVSVSDAPATGRAGAGAGAAAPVIEPMRASQAAGERSGHNAGAGRGQQAQANGAGRFESVSHDSDDYDELYGPDPPSADEDKGRASASASGEGSASASMSAESGEEVESRYAAAGKTQAQRSRLNAAKRASRAAVGGGSAGRLELSDSGSGSGSESSSEEGQIREWAVPRGAGAGKQALSIRGRGRGKGGREGSAGVEALRGGASAGVGAGRSRGASAGGSTAGSGGGTGSRPASPRTPAGDNGDGGAGTTRAPGGVSGRARRDFWAKKGQLAGAAAAAAAGAEFEDGEDFVGF